MCLEASNCPYQGLMDNEDRCVNCPYWIDDKEEFKELINGEINSVDKDGYIGGWTIQEEKMEE